MKHKIYMIEYKSPSGWQLFTENATEPVAYTSLQEAGDAIERMMADEDYSGEEMRVVLMEWTCSYDLEEIAEYAEMEDDLSICRYCNGPAHGGNSGICHPCGMSKFNEDVDLDECEVGNENTD